MAKNIKRHITHIKSKVVENGLPKLPAAADISEGEIAVNYAKGYETLSIKNESGDVVTFSEDKIIGSKGKLTGYAKASSVAAVATGDTINTAIGKLEKALDGKSNTDTNVAQKKNTENKSFPIILKNTNNATDETATTKYASGVEINPANGRLSATTFNQIITGTGTAATTGTSGTSTVYYPAKWTFNKGVTVSDGDIFTIKIPVAGHSYGVYISLNNGTNYYPVATNSNSRLTSHYPVNTYVTVVYESGNTVTSIYPVSGATATGTSAAGIFRVINFYDSNSTDISNTNYAGTIYKAVTNTYRYVLLLKYSETSLLAVNSANNNTGTGKTITTTDFDPFGPIFYYGTTTSAATNGVYGGTTLKDGYQLDLRYSFNINTSTLTAYKDVYLVAEPQANGRAKLHNTTTTGITNSCITQTLPTTDDGLIYIYLGSAYNGYCITLARIHPIYQFRNGSINNYTSNSSTPIYSAVTISANQTNVTCPATITGASKSGAQAIVIYKNGGTSTVWTVTVSSSAGYVTPDGNQLTLYCRKGGYTEINYLNIGGTIYVRGV